MIVLDPAKCSGCRRCEVHCSFFHTGAVARSLARVKVVKIEDIGLDVPVHCQQCRERYCTRCPESAIQIGPLGQVIVSPTLCTACGACEALCPIGAIELFDGIPYVCDLCGGRPKCVSACTMDAIRLAPDAVGEIGLKSFKQGAKGLTPEEKRIRFARDRFRALRDNWLAAKVS